MVRLETSLKDDTLTITSAGFKTRNIYPHFSRTVLRNVSPWGLTNSDWAERVLGTTIVSGLVQIKLLDAVEQVALHRYPCQIH